jgi:hypothetical protein
LTSAEQPAMQGKLLVLPDRIELSTSPFITLTLSRPPQAAFVRWTIPSP